MSISLNLGLSLSPFHSSDLLPNLWPSYHHPVKSHGRVGSGQNGFFSLLSFSFTASAFHRCSGTKRNEFCPSCCMAPPLSCLCITCKMYAVGWQPATLLEMSTSSSNSSRVKESPDFMSWRRSRFWVDLDLDLDPSMWLVLGPAMVLMVGRSQLYLCSDIMFSLRDELWMMKALTRLAHSCVLGWGRDKNLDLQNKKSLNRV